MTFAALKKRMLAKLAEEGCDEEVAPYLELINSHPDYVTSSSCYGRIMLIDLPNYTKKDSKFLWKKHRIVTVAEAWKALKAAKGRFVWFKMDPLILHVSCRNVKAAERLLRVKAAAGMKRGGIFAIAPQRVQIELEGTYRLEAPVKKGKKLLADEKYFSLLVENANSKFGKNRDMWERFACEFKMAPGT